MTTRLTQHGLRSPEAAERLGIRGRDVYMMLFAGELDGGPDPEGLVYFDEASMEGYLERHGYGVVAGSSTGSSTGSGDTQGEAEVRGGTSDPRNPELRGTAGYQTTQAKTRTVDS